MEDMAKDPMTATEVRFRLGEFERSEAMEQLRQGIENTIEQLFERVCCTPIQFRFPRSKKKRIRKKWRKDPRNFKRLLDTDQFEDIQIVGQRSNEKVI
jgi:hypothetical protein